MKDSHVKDSHVDEDGRWRMEVQIKDPKLWKAVKRGQVAGVSVDARGGMTWLMRPSWYKRLWYWLRARLPW